VSIAVDLEATSDAADGLGTPPSTPIVALPPIEKLQPSLRLDPATGEPPRSAVVRIAFWLLLLASLAEVGTIALTWWRAIHMESFPGSARLIAWTHPNPGSIPSLLIAAATMLIGVILVAAPVLAGYLAWVGQPSAVWWAIGALVLTSATYVVTAPTSSGASWLSPLWSNLGWLAVPLTLIGAAILWLPPARRSFADWKRFRATTSPATPPADIVYGRLEQFR